MSTTYLYITENCLPGWSSHQPKETDSLGRQRVNLVEAELRDGMVHITKCVVPKMAPRRRLSATVFLRDFAPEKVRAACVAASRERILSLLLPGSSMLQEALQEVMEHCGHHFGGAAISSLTREGELQVRTAPPGREGEVHLSVYRNRQPVPDQCISGNGRTDGHMSYLQGNPLGGSPVCAFCLKES